MLSNTGNAVQSPVGEAARQKPISGAIVMAMCNYILVKSAKKETKATVHKEAAPPKPDNTPLSQSRIVYVPVCISIVVMTTRVTHWSPRYSRSTRQCQDVPHARYRLRGVYTCVYFYIIRNKLLFETLDLNALLKENGVTEMDTFAQAAYVESTSSRSVDYAAMVPVTPFDDFTLATRTPLEWMAVVEACGGALPAMAYVYHDGFAWERTYVNGYDADRRAYLVSSSQSVDMEQVDSTAITTVPYMLVRFVSEDPRLYAHRLGVAYRLRADALLRIKFTYFIDCMPTTDVTTDLMKTTMPKPALQRGTSSLAPGKGNDKAKLADLRKQMAYKDFVTDYKRTSNLILAKATELSSNVTLDEMYNCHGQFGDWHFTCTPQEMYVMILVVMTTEPGPQLVSMRQLTRASSSSHCTPAPRLSRQ